MQFKNRAAALGTAHAAALCSEDATGISNLAGAISAGEPCSDHGHSGGNSYTGHCHTVNNHTWTHKESFAIPLSLIWGWFYHSYGTEALESLTWSQRQQYTLTQDLT